MSVQRIGTVIAFDEEQGFGSLRDEAGDEWFFHCTAIADGSRKIGLDASVAFVLRPGHRGEMEANQIVCCPEHLM